MTGSTRPLTVEDRLLLQELIARYSLARDDRDIDSLLDLFAPDAEFERAGRVVRGREEIREFFLASMRRYDLTNHVTHTQVLDPLPLAPGEPVTVAGTVTGHAELVLDGSLHVAAYRYYDVYTPSDRRWLLRRRSLNFMYAMPVGELSSGFATTERVRWAGQEPQTADIPETLPTWRVPAATS
ncbi:nuclear transport factor 2 family protein [Nocardioides sp. TF02-7]|uniref:nuclear transport factor 2 family protein n=1 Tax=Nocardioides sp. TF02-7 TaxID=2917724 RepID=UPI001F0597D1|nr:nuclear transport factor 2 family protein [Nocardioides sp. TF02-7]UMG91260.1 nuclear transport factor 2 family protein [Nocardioides sp. TF02-7]